MWAKMPDHIILIPPTMLKSWRETLIFARVKKPQIARFRGQHGAHEVLLAPDGPHVGRMNLAIRERLGIGFEW